MNLRPKQFASDNYAGICPEAWQALAEANHGHVVSYGDDPWTEQACDLIRKLFETPCEVFFVFNGTAANSLGLSAMCQSYHSILCHDKAHIETDECGAPEFFSNGTKLLHLPGENGKLTPEVIAHAVHRRSDIHYPKPRVVSITQATELGTVYTVDEIRALGDCARTLGLRMHLDGARLANALATLGVAPKEITWQAGVEVLSLGGTKNGGLMGEAVVFFNLELAREFDYRCKQAGQLASKMRFLSSWWMGLLKDGAWLRYARHSNQMAARMEAELRGLAGVKILLPREANSVFVQMPEPAIADMHRRGWRFYTFIGQGGCRLMCSWDTTAQDVAEFIGDLKLALQTAGK